MAKNNQFKKFEVTGHKNWDASRTFKIEIKAKSEAKAKKQAEKQILKSGAFAVSVERAREI